MTDFLARARLAKSATRVGMAEIAGGQLDYEGAADALVVAAAVFVALLPESEWQDVLDRFTIQMPDAVAGHARRMGAAGIAQSKATRQ